MLQIGGRITVGNTIDGFAAGDLFDFTGIGSVGASAAIEGGNTLVVSNGTVSQDLTLDPSGNYASTWTVVSDGSGGSIVACYCHGTRIAVPGGETAVEALGIGDAVLTAAGAVKHVRWIGRRRYGAADVAAHRAARPIRIRAGALAAGVPHRDLLVSPEHALSLDGVLVPTRQLVNGVSIVRCDAHAEVAYFHIELAEHEIILAEGAAAETFVDCDSRAMFENAAEFARLYPNEPVRRWAYCAERVEEGEQLEAIRRRLNARAGIGEIDARGPLIGFVERVTDTFIEGWAQDAAALERPVRLEIIADGLVVANVLANRHRDDLAAAGLGSGRHAFSVRLMRPAHRIEVRRAEDGAMLGSLATSEIAA